MPYTRVDILVPPEVRESRGQCLDDEFERILIAFDGQGVRLTPVAWDGDYARVREDSVVIVPSNAPRVHVIDFANKSDLVVMQDGRPVDKRGVPQSESDIGKMIKEFVMTHVPF